MLEDSELSEIADTTDSSSESEEEEEEATHIENTEEEDEEDEEDEYDLILNELIELFKKENVLYKVDPVPNSASVKKRRIIINQGKILAKFAELSPKLKEYKNTNDSDKIQLVLPKFNRLNHIINICTVYASLKKFITTRMIYKHLDVRDYDIFTSNKVNSIKNYTVFLKYVLRVDVVPSKFTTKQMFEIYLWYARFIPFDVYEQMGQFNDDYQVAFCEAVMNMLNTQQLFSTGIAAEYSKIKEPLFEDEVISDDIDVNNEMKYCSSSFYVLFIGFSLDNNSNRPSYGLTFKFGKTNRKFTNRTSRYKEHSRTPEFCGYDVAGIYRCGNANAMENFVNDHFKKNKIKYFKQKEVFVFKNVDEYLEFYEKAEEYADKSKVIALALIENKKLNEIIENLKLENEREREKHNAAIKEKDEQLLEKDEQIKMIELLHKEELDDKDKEIKKLKTKLRSI